MPHIIGFRRHYGWPLRQPFRCQPEAVASDYCQRQRHFAIITMILFLIAAMTLHIILMPLADASLALITAITAAYASQAPAPFSLISATRCHASRH